MMWFNNIFYSCFIYKLIFNIFEILYFKTGDSKFKDLQRQKDAWMFCGYK